MMVSNIHTQLVLSIAHTYYTSKCIEVLQCTSTCTCTLCLVFPCTHSVYILDAFSVMLDSKSTTSLTISWTLADGLTATLYTISYSNTNNTDCITAGYPDIPISAGVSSRILTGLEEATEYSITVTATLSDGGTREDSLTATTIASG